MGLKRKLERKQMTSFFKQFKKRMKQFKSMVRCTVCERPPAPGENIDSWRIKQQSENIDLVCVDCHESEKEKT